jgi:hypothetical protein
MKKEENAMEQKFNRLNVGEKRLRTEMKSLILSALKENSGKISFTPEDEDDEYPVSATLWGKHDNPIIDITAVYLSEKGEIYADGVNQVSGCMERFFEIYSEQYSDILHFIAAVLGWKTAESEEEQEEDNPLEVTILFGSDVIREYKETGELPSEEWLNENGGVIDTKTFETEEQMKAYFEGLNDADGWLETLVLDEFMVKLLEEDRKSGF